MTGVRVGSVRALWRYPVKSMLGEEIPAADLGPTGVAGDRAWALLDARTGRIASAKNPALWGRMFQLRASYPAPPKVGEPPPSVRIGFPDGEEIDARDGGVDDRLSKFLGREVRLVTSTASRPAVEQYSPPFQELGLAEGTSEFRVSTGPFHDSLPIHLLTDATLRKLREVYPRGVFDARRFRPNVYVESEGPGFVEQSWLGRTLTVGSARLQITRPCGRCVMTTLPQGDLSDDRGILQSVLEHADGDVGVKGVVVGPERVSRGDSISL